MYIYSKHTYIINKDMKYINALCNSAQLHILQCHRRVN